MSWSASGTATAHKTSGGDRIGVKLDFEGKFIPQVNHAAAESVAAFQEAKQAVGALLESGAIGTGNFVVILSGHANPRNEPSQGWSNDSLNISISQK